MSGYGTFCGGGIIRRAGPVLCVLEGGHTGPHRDDSGGFWRADPWDACLDVDHGTDFYEDDEPAGKIRAEWAAAPKGLTGMWHEPDGCGHGDACESCTD